MDLTWRDEFLRQWRRFFGGEELPLTFAYTDEVGSLPEVRASRERRCLIAELARARAGEPLRFGAGSCGCPGGRRYTGFGERLRPDFEYFLSCGIPGKVEGERYKRSPELVRELLARAPAFTAPARYLVVKRIDLLTAADQPAVATFFARPDTLAGLFTLAGFDTVDDDAVIAPFGAGCATIVQRPFLEAQREYPRGVIGLFDISARPFVPPETLCFSVPVGKLQEMVAAMDESFLITPSWAAVQARLRPAEP